MQPEHKPRVFLDSNVIFSGIYSPQGPAGIILEHFINGKIDIVISQQVLEEEARTIKEKLPEALSALQTLLINSTPEIIKDPLFEDIARWFELINNEDASILAAAIAAQPDYLVTGDKHFFENRNIARQTELSIATPAQFLQRMKKDFQSSP